MLDRRQPRPALFSLAVIILAACGDAAAAQPGERIARIVEAYGGEEALSRVQQMESEWVGYSIGRHQSRYTDPPYDRLPVRNWSAFDFATGRSVVDSIGTYPGELNFGTRAINNGRRRMTLNTIAGIYVEGGMYSHEGMVASATNRMPWLLVRDMAAHPGQSFYSRGGATIMTTRDKEGFLRRLLSRAWGEHPAVTDAWFRFIEEPRLVLEDGSNRLDIHVYADAPHSENMLVGYLPSSGLLYTCDIFIGWIGEAVQGASYGTRHLAEFVSRRQAGGDLGPVKDYATCHGRPYSAAEFSRMIGTERAIVTLPGNDRWPSATWFQHYGLDDGTTGDPRRRHVVDRPGLQ